MQFKSLDDAAPPTNFADVLRDVEKEARGCFNPSNRRFIQFPEVLIV